MGERKVTMRWQCLVVLVIVSFASSESSADEVQTLGDYYGDMSVTTDSDGEVTPGRFGDYSDWVKKYHIGAHHPYHATKVGEHKVRHHKASSHAPSAWSVDQRLASKSRLRPSRSPLSSTRLCIKSHLWYLRSYLLDCRPFT